MNISETSGTSLWLGTERGWTQLVRALEKIEQRSQQAISQVGPGDLQQMAASLGLKPEVLADGGGEFDGYDYLVTRADNVAIIHIKGPLVSDDSPWNRYFGVVSYPELRNAAISAAEHPEVSAILLDIDSPGGQVSGIDEIVGLLKNIDAHTPIYSCTGGDMCSGAYWLGSVGREVYSTELAEVGSIGVIAVHMDYSEHLADNGIKPTVIRKGEFKALGSPYEPLSAKALQEINTSMGEVYDAFVGSVAANRKLPESHIRDKAAEGRVFHGKKALEVGLVDENIGLDAALAKIQRRHGVQHQNILGGNPMTKKKVITQAVQDAIASGVTEDQALADELLTDNVDADAGVDASADTDGALNVDVAAGADDGDSPSEPVVADTGVVQLLTEQLATAQQQVVDLRVELGESKNLIEKTASTHENMRAIAVEATQRMQVALGGVPMGMDTLDATVVVSQYNATYKEFCARFKIGATAKPPIDRPDDGGNPVLQPLDAAKRSVVKIKRG